MIEYDSNNQSYNRNRIKHEFVSCCHKCWMDHPAMVLAHKILLFKIYKYIYKHTNNTYNKCKYQKFFFTLRQYYFSYSKEYYAQNSRKIKRLTAKGCYRFYFSGSIIESEFQILIQFRSKYYKYYSRNKNTCIFHKFKPHNHWTAGYSRNKGSDEFRYSVYN